MATVVRQVKRFQRSDWYTDAYTQATSADNQRTAAFDVCQEARFLRNETDCQTKWDQYSTEVRLADRVNNLRRWKDLLERNLRQLDQEIADLSEAKETAEGVLENLNLRTDVAVECLTLREGRRKIEVVADEPENELYKEFELIESWRKNVQQRIAEAFGQLCLLQEARQQVQSDLEDKTIAMGIDIDQYNLSDRSPGITFKPDPLRVPKGSTSILEWDERSRFTKEKAESELAASSKLRLELYHTLQQTANELDAQKQATEYAFRKRMHICKRAKDELEYQKATIIKEVTEHQSELRGLEESIRKRNRSTMKAETRMENRTYRPNKEMCFDAAHYGLVDEVKQLRATTVSLEEKLQQAHNALDALARNMDRLNDQISLKNQTLRLDQQCLDIRQKLNPPAQKGIENNLILTGIERMKSAVLA
ncbi:unnamed protein product [Candidula unifasciata]|uniref:Tektin n=1 Tax=Candidula unifasciata TaxID=100452 RepID=A0A8S3YT16_9EUPU|nr:unnamed protein product [Candidula unifasciata]